MPLALRSVDRHDRFKRFAIGSVRSQVAVRAQAGPRAVLTSHVSAPAPDALHPEYFGTHPDMFPGFPSASRTGSGG